MSEFASHKVGDMVEFSVRRSVCRTGQCQQRPVKLRGQITEIDSTGTATIKTEDEQFYRDLCVLTKVNDE